MIWMFATIALAIGVDQPNRHELADCLAYLAQAPEYRLLSDDSLKANEQFLEAAKGRYCSDEVSPFWELAHNRARAKLGIPAEAPPNSEQQELAEREIRSLLAESLDEARRNHSKTIQLPDRKMYKFVMAWLLEEQNTAFIQSATETTILCSVATLKKNENIDVKDVFDGMTSPILQKIATACGYDGAQKTIAGKIIERFPELNASFAHAIAASLMGQATFWALTAH